MKIVQNTLKIEEKFSDVRKKFRVGPKKVGSVGFPETRHFFFFFLPYMEKKIRRNVCGLALPSGRSGFTAIIYQEGPDHVSWLSSTSGSPAHNTQQ